MHTRATYTVAGFRAGFHLFLHFFLLVICHSVEMFRQVTLGIIVYYIQYLINCVLMTEGAAGILILIVFQFINSVIHRNGKYIHGNSGAGADTGAGYSGIDFPLGFGSYRQRVLRFQRTPVHNRTDSII